MYATYKILKMQQRRNLRLQKATTILWPLPKTKTTSKGAIKRKQRNEKDQAQNTTLCLKLDFRWIWPRITTDNMFA